MVASRIVGFPPAAFHVVSPTRPTKIKSYPQPPTSIMAPLHRLLGPSFPQIAVRGLSSLDRLSDLGRTGVELGSRRMAPVTPAAHFDYLVSHPDHSSCLESLYTLSLYDELSAAVEEGVGEHRLMTLGNQSSSQLQTGANQKRGPPTLRRDEDPS